MPNKSLISLSANPYPVLNIAFAAISVNCPLEYWRMIRITCWCCFAVRLRIASLDCGVSVSACTSVDGLTGIVGVGLLSLPIFSSPHISLGMPNFSNMNCFGKAFITSLTSNCTPIGSICVSSYF